jgi:membrane-bound ClpP family serine protease
LTTEIIITLFIVGIILIILELLVIPGFGVSGILGIAALFAGIIFISNTWYEAVLYSFGTIIILGILVYWSFRFKGTRKIWERLSLSTRQTNDTGYTAPKNSYEDYLGRYGTAITQLRPAGTADFQGDRVDVVTEGGYIEAGSKVKVIAVEGVRIIVREES